MYYRINEVSTIVDSGSTYVHVDYWRRKSHFDRGDRPYLTNSFYMHLDALVSVPRRRDGYYERTDSSYVAPADTDAVPLNEFASQGPTMRERIIKAVEKYGRHHLAEGWSGDHTEDTSKPLKRNGALVRQGVAQPVTRDNSDPHRVLEQIAVTSLRGRKHNAD